MIARYKREYGPFKTQSFCSKYQQESECEILCDDVMTVSTFFQNLHDMNPHSSPIRARYRLSLMSPNSNLSSGVVIVVLYVISWYIWQCHNGTWLYMLYVASYKLNIWSVYYIRNRCTMYTIIDRVITITNRRLSTKRPRFLLRFNVWREFWEVT